ncbi:MAG: MATE family efflux transporter [Tissierellia bacterium]|nr:MATE family efflux transporter [Tissierellia bacterium]
MGAKIAALEKEKIGKLLFRFAIPIIISYLISELYGMVDTLFIGKYVGDRAVGAVLVVYPLQRIVVALGIMVSIGTSTNLGRALGNRDYPSAGAMVGTGRNLILLIALPVALIVLLAPNVVLRYLGATGEMMDLGREYLRYIAVGFPFILLTMYLSNVMLSFGNEKVAVLTNGVGALLNILIDYILIGQLGMGVAGAAIATLVSQIVGFALALKIFQKYRRELKLSWTFSMDRALALAIIQVGFSAFIIEAEDGILMTVLNNLMSRSVGEGGIVVLGIATKLYMFLFVTLCGIAAAMQPITAFNDGAKNYGRIRKVMVNTTLYAALTSTVIWAICMIWTKPLVMLFLRDAALIDYAVKAFRWMIACFPLITVYYCATYYLQAIGEAKKSVSLALVRQLLLLLPMSIFFVKGLGMGEMGIFLAYPVSDCLSFLVGLWMLRGEEKALETKIRLKTAYA